MEDGISCEGGKLSRSVHFVRSRLATLRRRLPLTDLLPFFRKHHHAAKQLRHAGLLQVIGHLQRRLAVSIDLVVRLQVQVRVAHLLNLPDQLEVCPVNNKARMMSIVLPPTVPSNEARPRRPRRQGRRHGTHRAAHKMDHSPTRTNTTLSKKFVPSQLEK